MGSILEALRQNAKDKEKLLAYEERVRDAQAKEKHEMTMIRINRHHARQEINRYKKQEQEITKIMTAYDPLTPEYQQAQQNIAHCKAEQNRLTEQLEDYDRQFNTHEDHIKIIEDHYQQGVQQVKDRTHKRLGQAFTEKANFFKNIKNSIVSKIPTKQDFENFVTQTMDGMAALPGDTKKMAQDLADNATATLSDLNDAMDTAIHDANAKGLVAFNGLEEQTTSIMRAHRAKDIEYYEKDLAKVEKLIEAVDVVEAVLDNKKEQAKNIGKGFKSLFTDWRTKDAAQQDAKAQEEAPAQNPAARIEQMGKDMQEQKPGFLRRIVNRFVVADTKKLEQLYNEQIQSYDKSLERSEKIADQIKGQGYTSMEQRLQQVQDKALNEMEKLDNKKMDLAKKKDDLLR